MQLTYNEFKNWLFEEVENFARTKYENVKVKIENVEKVNESYEAIITILENHEVVPAINIPKFFQSYCMHQNLNKSKGDMELLLQQKQTLKLDWITNLEIAKKYFFIKVFGIQSFHDELEKIPHKKINDFVITYHISLQLNQGSGASCLITNQLLKHYKITLDQLHEMAIESGQKQFPPVLKKSSDYANRLDDENQFYILTNHDQNYGSAVLFYPKMLETLGQSFSDFYIIPSSVHELLLMQANKQLDVKSLLAMLHTINQSYVAKKEQISNHIYLYHNQQNYLETLSNETLFS